MKRIIGTIILSSTISLTGCVGAPPAGPPTTPQPAPQAAEQEVAQEPEDEPGEAEVQEPQEVQATVTGDGEEVHATVVDENGQVVHAHVKTRKRVNAKGEEEEEGEVTITGPDGQVINYRSKGSSVRMQVTDPETGEDVEVETEGE